MLFRSELVGSPKYLGKLIKIGDFTWDSKLDIYDTGIEVYDYDLNETYFNRSYAPKNSYKFKVINGKIRLYANIEWFQTAVYPIFFNFHTWTIPTDSAWGNGTNLNTTNVQATGNVELEYAVPDYLHKYRFDEGSGTIEIGRAHV